MVSVSLMVALSDCTSDTCGVRPCSVVSTDATVCESLGSFRSNVKVAVTVTASAGLKSQEAFCVVRGIEFSPKENSAQPRVATLQKRLPGKARSRMNSEAIAAGGNSVCQCAAALRRKWCRPRGAARDGRWRRTKRDGRGRKRADVLRISAPIECLIAQLHVQIARGAQKIDAGRVESGGDVGLGKIKQARARICRVGNRQIEPAV